MQADPFSPNANVPLLAARCTLQPSISENE